MTDPRAPRPDRPADDPEYSATALASHWFQRPDTQPEDATEPTLRAAVEPDRVEGTVLRFGPGVTAHMPVTAVMAMPSPQPAVQPAPAARSVPAAPRRLARGRRFVLPALVLLCVLAFLAWQRYGPTVAVRDAAVHTEGVVLTGADGSADGTGTGCGGTADIVGVVRTDGRPGTFTYRWLRSDGTTSGVLSERVRRGQREARLHLLWTFSGEGEYRARADLEILSPSRHGAGTTFPYACPGGVR
ncbi:hypothetical protein [Streptomyces sp. TRM49041]|uniref:hypothetical protein n=1 Tax=Streptomyces sp. TRM49041 TaxID=2603216 RepID=UPI0011F06446|nr:hypothetical protein [Streptomyces sp. TRM49041]